MPEDFICLTEERDCPYHIYVRVTEISAVYEKPHDEYTTVCLKSGGFFSVKEKAVEILKLINKYENRGIRI